MVQKCCGGEPEYMAVVLINTVNPIVYYRLNFVFISVIFEHFRLKIYTRTIRLFLFQKSTNNGQSFKHIDVWQDVALPNAERVREIDKMIESGKNIFCTF